MNKRGLAYLLLLPLLIYYSGYLILFSFHFNGEPLVNSVHSELVLAKDISGKVFSEFDPSVTHDFIFLGSSHCYRSFDPRIFRKAGYSAYNLGSSSQTPLNSYHILKNSKAKAKNVILEIYPVTLQLSGKESFLSLNASLRDYGFLIPMLLDLRDARCLNALTIKPFIDHYNLNKPYNIETHYNGYVETIDSAGVGISYESITLDNDVLNKNLQYLDNIAKLCTKENAKLILVYAPVPSELQLINEKESIEIIKNFASKNNLEFFNWGRDHQLKSSDHFSDDDHLNAAGVELFNMRLLDHMTQ